MSSTYTVTQLCIFVKCEFGVALICSLISISVQRIVGFINVLLYITDPTVSHFNEWVDRSLYIVDNFIPL